MVYVLELDNGPVGPWVNYYVKYYDCLLYTSDAADDMQ